MAIDSRDKRASACNTEMPWNHPGWNPDGVMTEADRADVSHNYRGILPSGGLGSKLWKDWWWTDE